MSTGGVEFIDESDPSPVEPDPADGRRPRLLRAVAVFGWAAAAVLAVVAPFQAVYGSVRVPRGYADYLSAGPTGIDGWGRGPGGQPAGGVTFGVALAVCAAMFAALAVFAGIRLLRAHLPTRLRFGVAAAAVGAPCLLAGVVGTLGLYVDSVTSGSGSPGWTIYAPTQPSDPVNGAGASYSSALRVSVTSYPVGNCLWFALAALGIAVLATAAYLLAERADRRLAG